MIIRAVGHKYLILSLQVISDNKKMDMEFVTRRLIFLLQIIKLPHFYPNEKYVCKRKGLTSKYKLNSL